jgi:hypothetical protein
MADISRMRAAVQLGGVRPGDLGNLPPPFIPDYRRRAFRLIRFTNTSFSTRVRASARNGLQIGGQLKPGRTRHYRVTLGLGA